MSAAYRCDLCHEYDEGIPEHAPEEWTIPDLHLQLEGIDFRVAPIFKLMTTAKLDLCPKCVRRISVEILRTYAGQFRMSVVSS